MKNGYFQLVNDEGHIGLKLVPPVDGGEKAGMNEVMDYLSYRNLVYDFSELNRMMKEAEDTVVIRIADGICPKENECFKLTVSADRMCATARFYAPSETGECMDYAEIENDLKHQSITSGIMEENIKEYLQNRNYCTDIIVAQGTAPRHGTDAEIQYFFSTDLSAKPALREDGSVDFFNLNTISHCRKGDVLAKLIPADLGAPGQNIYGERILPREVKKAHLKFGRNIELTEDKSTIISKVDGHVVLVDGKVFVSDVLEVENVDNSTGNIEYEGSVQINGNVCSNFKVKARGNIVVNGVVEGACLEAGNDIIIARGMNGMNKGTLTAGGNIIAKFLENAEASAGGYVSTESILHSQVMAGTEVTVNGKRGFITGGRVCATDCIHVKTLGSQMGATTSIEVGASPVVKMQFQDMQKLAGEIQKVLRSITPTVEAFEKKKEGELHLSEEQMTYIMSLQKLRDMKMKELEETLTKMENLQEKLKNKNDAQIIVTGEVFPGTRIAIGEVSMMVQSSFKYCRFVKREGEVKMTAL